ncbi:hypothetical protein [Pseudodesulfovibrio sp. zrk46]|uniref:hypothetical protein n=1 Tax=Pseudodesulfovibrio sp. zrk46 TaxID=2725288 RepID=UPI001449398B|nr:hypothetical protein [Pseudodesulfovibrio sp. zrk46]QJB55417.1 hypothetical protein HFN16_02980 [Pseudodesulfovibrio sp. zrk46]
MQTLAVRKFSFMTLFKLYYIGNVGVFIPMTLWLYWASNNPTISGVPFPEAYVWIDTIGTMIIFPLLMASIFSGITYLCQFAFAKIRPITIKVKVDKPNIPEG